MVDYNQNSMSNCNEVMNVLNSLPISALVVNSELKLLEINRIAQIFLKVDNVDSCCGEEQMFITDREYLKRIIKEIQSGIVVSNKKLVIRKLDKSVSLVEFFAHPLCGVKDMYLFLFFELNHSNTIKLEVMSKAKLTGANSSIQKVNADETKHLNSIIHKRYIGKLIPGPLYNEFLDQSFMLKISKKYPQLSESDIVVCGLISLRKSTSEIAIIINKTENCTRVITHRIVHRLNLSTRRELFHKLVAIDSPMVNL
jgi:DNA-binding CsgD family transcriptional regulator